MFSFIAVTSDVWFCFTCPAFGGHPKPPFQSLTPQPNLFASDYCTVHRLFMSGLFAEAQHSFKNLVQRRTAKILSSDGLPCKKKNNLTKEQQKKKNTLPQNTRDTWIFFCGSVASDISSHTVTRRGVSNNVLARQCFVVTDVRRPSRRFLLFCLFFFFFVGFIKTTSDS